MNNLVKTNIPWLPFIKSDWKIVRVKNIFYASKEKAHQENPTILSLARSGVKVRDISNNEGQLAESYFDYNPVKPGDLLLNPMDLYSGANCNVSEVEGVISPAYANLRSKIKLEPKFFDYYFKTQYWAMAMFAHGKGVSFDNRWTINNETLMNYELPFPDIDEQYLIVEILKNKTSKIETLIKNQEEQISKLEEYKIQLISKYVYMKENEDRYITSIEGIPSIPVGWKILPIKQLFSLGKGLPITKENLIDSGMKVISYGQIHAKYNKSVDIDDRLFRFVSPEYLETNAECLVGKNDYIFADTSEDLKGVGDFIHIDRDDNIFAGYHCITLQKKAEFNPDYVAYQFMTDDWREFFRCRVGGVKLFSLTKKLLNQGFVILPPIEVQNKIADLLKEKCNCIERMIEIKQSKIEKLHVYKKSLIYEYITGKKEV